jgi:hypothetical protein
LALACFTYLIRIHIWNADPDPGALSNVDQSDLNPKRFFFFFYLLFNPYNQIYF